ncbi:MAG: aldehyde ferredoxin oxidoreductase family protein [Desulfohalobiaceae bacterium]|nr:aldehyde ferredoxin oxidoreductase family protein [Desulfohalobiaceae bacterium]
MHGYCGKMLRVDLTSGKIQEEPLEARVIKDYIGGRGLGIYYLNQELDPGVDPLSSENMMVMATGPLTGTGAPTGSRYMVMTKSPLTGAITCSNSGGMFPTQLKKSGLDGIIFTGKSEEPVYLWIEDGRYELRQAGHLWGKTTHETTDQILAETDAKARVACIGPAGERGVLFASIMNDRDRAAGRSGVGAVMGSKNLKAIAVRGSQKIGLADPDGFKAFNKSIIDGFKEATRETPLGLTVNGTAGVVAVTQAYGALPTKNWQQGTFEGWKSVQGATLTEKYLSTNSACFGCPIGCGRKTRVEDPDYHGEGEGPEYETIYAMGPNCMIDNLAAIVKANYVCNELGLDTITMGATLACAMELFDRGYLREEDVGQKLLWGDGRALVDMARKTGYREGFGDVLAQGSYRMAERYGHPELAMVTKKQEFPGYEPRGEQAMGLAYATSPIGGSHMRGDPAYFELFGVPKAMDPLQWEGKARVTKDYQNLSAVIDAAGLCIFFAVRNLAGKELDVPPTGILEYLNTATGLDYTLEELIQASERIINAERKFLNAAGFSKKDDSLPARLTREPMPSGPAKGQVCHLEEMLEEYYQIRNWDGEGRPTRERLKELGLE